MMWTMYCTECYLENGRGTEPALYIFGGKSLCYIHFWKETGVKPSTEVATTGKAVAKRGSRVQESWMPSADAINRIHDEFPWITRDQFAFEHRKFIDYWMAKSGQQATKLDWDRTWCNWMRTAAERMPHPRSEGVSTVDTKVNGWLEAGERLGGE